MAVLVIYPQLDNPKTGGQVYDFHFLGLLKRAYGGNRYSELLDASFEHEPAGSLGYEIAYLRKYRQISGYNTIITNSRLYPRLLCLFLILRLFSSCHLVVLHHHFNFLTQKGFKKYVHKVLELLFLRMADVTIVPSPYVRDLMRKYCPDNQVSYIEIPFKNKDAVVLRRDNAVPQLLFVGTVEPRKGVMCLVEMADCLVQKGIRFHLTIAGRIPAGSLYFHTLTAYVKSHNLYDYITFAGRVSHERLQALYQEADIFVFPSSHEGYGMVLLEAMSHSLPVVTFNNSAMPYTVRNYENGLLAENGNVQDLSSKVTLLMTDGQLREKLAEGAVNTYNNSHTVVDFEKEVLDFIGNVAR